MKLKKSLMRAAIATTMGLGAMGQAQASIYAGALLEIDNFVVSFQGLAPTPPPNFNVKSFTFAMTNTANLNGLPIAATSANCFGTPSFNNCGGVPTLDAQPAQIGSAFANNTFSFQGPGANEYAHADSVINTAQLVDGVPSSTQNIAQSELQTGTNGDAASNIQSNTGFTMQFSAGGPGTLTISFNANVDLLASISDNFANIANAQAQTTTQILFSEDNTNNSVTWNPTTAKGLGACGGDALQSGAGVTCVNDEISENLNNSVAVNTLPNSSDPYSLGTAFNPYFLSVSFANAGDYSLTLTETKTVLVNRLSVPEPALLLLLSTGLIGIGFARCVRKA